MSTSDSDNTREYHDALVAHLLEADGADAMLRTLKALLTDSELDEISKRLQILNMLKKGIPQRQIAETLGVGIATVTRGSRALRRNS